MIKKKIDLGIIILHYNNIEDTLECVNSFKKRLDTLNYHILVFDNCSPNGSGKTLEKKLRNTNKVELYLNNENLGFGGGNNKAIKIFRKKFDAKFIVLSNNDIVLIDNNFFEKINTEFNYSHFAELGPMILTADGRCDSNPIFDIPYYKDTAIAEGKELKAKYKSVKFFYKKFHIFFRRLKFKLSKKFRDKRRKQLRKNKSDGIFLERRENVVCHGCFMVFSEMFFRYYEGINLHSFMYAEEDILFLQILHKKLKTVYAPNILVYHKEGRSVSKSYENNRKREMFLLEKYIEANKGYISYIEELEKEGFYLNQEEQSWQSKF